MMKNSNNCSSSSKEFPFCINIHTSDVGSKEKTVNLKYNLNLKLLTWIYKLDTIFFGYKFMIYTQMQSNFFAI